MNKYLKLHICFQQVLRHTGAVWKWNLKEELSGFFLFSLRIGKWKWPLSWCMVAATQTRRPPSPKKMKITSCLQDHHKDATSSLYLMSRNKMSGIEHHMWFDEKITEIWTSPSRCTYSHPTGSQMTAQYQTSLWILGFPHWTPISTSTLFHGQKYGM